MIKSIIVAVAKNNVIGKDNNLIWHLPKDMNFFKNTTKGHCVIMGRKNYESIPEKFRPLPGRTNIVISRNKNYNAPDCVLCSSLEEALDSAQSQGETEVFIIGGGQIYNIALSENLVDRLYITHINKDYQGDTFFPSMSVDLWQKTTLFSHEADEKHEAGFTVVRYDKTT